MPLMSEIQLDPELRYWTLVPITIIVLCVLIIKHHLNKLVQPKLPQLTALELREQGYLRYAHLLRAHHKYLPLKESSRRIQYLVPKLRSKAFLADPHEKPPSAIPNLLDERNSEAMFANVRQQIFSYIPQTLIMQFITAFFGSAIVLKLPFRVPRVLKPLLQTNLYTDDLDSHYVSSVSCFLLLLVGLESVLYLIHNFYEEEPTLKKPIGDVVQPIPPQIYRKQVFKAEADELEMTVLHSEYSNTE